jgi:hypothetical protein
MMGSCQSMLLETLDDVGRLADVDRDDILGP